MVLPGCQLDWILVQSEIHRVKWTTSFPTALVPPVDASGPEHVAFVGLPVDDVALRPLPRWQCTAESAGHQDPASSHTCHPASRYP